MRSLILPLVGLFMAYAAYRTVYIALGSQKRAVVRRVARKNWIAIVAILLLWVAVVLMTLGTFSIKVF